MCVDTHFLHCTMGKTDGVRVARWACCRLPQVLIARWVLGASLATNRKRWSIWILRFCSCVLDIAMQRIGAQHIGALVRLVHVHWHFGPSRQVIVHGIFCRFVACCLWSVDPWCFLDLLLFAVRWLIFDAWWFWRLVCWQLFGGCMSLYLFFPVSCCFMLFDVCAFRFVSAVLWGSLSDFADFRLQGVSVPVTLVIKNIKAILSDFVHGNASRLAYALSKNLQCHYVSSTHPRHGTFLSNSWVAGNTTK